MTNYRHLALEHGASVEFTDKLDKDLVNPAIIREVRYIFTEAQFVNFCRAVEDLND